MHKENWQNLVSNFGGNDFLEKKWWQILINVYCEPHRHYHTLEHITHLIDLHEQFRKYLRKPENVLLAIWFHDSVYDTQKNDNEEQSKNLFLKFASEIGLNEDDTILICNYILATKDPCILTKYQNNTDLFYFLDFDLAILGSSPEKYNLYKQQIRQEYSHLSDRDFKSGRTKVISKLLEGEIFKTDELRKIFFLQAKANMKNELLDLSIA